MTAPKSAAYIAELVGMWNTGKYTVTLLAHHFDATPASIIGLIARARKKGLVTISKIGVPGGSGRKYKRAEARKTARPKKSSGGVDGHTVRQTRVGPGSDLGRENGLAMPQSPTGKPPTNPAGIKPGPLDRTPEPGVGAQVPNLGRARAAEPAWDGDALLVVAEKTKEACVRNIKTGSAESAGIAEGGSPSPVFGQFTLDQAQQNRGCRWQTQAPPDRRFCGQPIAPGWLDFCTDHKRRAIGRHVPHLNTGRREPGSARILEA